MAIPEPKYQNSAGRLLAILSVVPNNQSLLDSMPPIFGFGGSNKHEKQQSCLQALVELHRLYLEFQQDMVDAQINDAQRQVILAGLSGIQRSIFPTNLETVFQAVSEAEKSLLEVAATVIVPDEKLQTDDIEAIRASIAELRTLVERADVPGSIRKVLLDLIRMSEDAISRFNIHGARGLRKAFKAMLAEAAEAHGLTKDDKDREALKKSGVWEAIGKHLKVFDAVASRLMKYRPLFEAASQFLLGGPPSHPG